jgi:hypothetical protein
MSLAMPKDFEDHPKEPARKKAERRWRNHDVEKRFKEEKAKPAPKEPNEIEFAETIKNKELKKGTITRAQTKFAKYLRELMNDHKARTERKNFIVYALSIRAQRYKLLKEKLRRLELREADRVAASQYPQQNQGGRRDLFS